MLAIEYGTLIETSNCLYCMSAMQLARSTIWWMQTASWLYHWLTAIV